MRRSLRRSGIEPASSNGHAAELIFSLSTYHISSCIFHSSQDFSYLFLAPFPVRVNRQFRESESALSPALFGIYFVRSCLDEGNIINL